ncbi:hypothetical protein DICSQDRAFT_93122 [Dichomitus squalens LYAD-421 SS1]|uniref:Endoplasmic reticulum junction formation protein lunapark n=1 Tax=Dichomitus squalens (strain LYAD-421) TaxID=732165 RepID=R7SKY3_DICSQ|nr:uncharacterized protein DICSQDRAFT_93122 [Dichomitus squalens LYAD-421 SS1]EJF56794.1 hypothetical protein DICSQDRAFT_93122 [Dichomitus squalens LYAD-421 SS1]
MGLFSRWFKPSQPEDYEQALALLAQDIQKRQTRLSEIRLRERRATLLVSVWALVAWVTYTSLWYMDFLPNITTHQRSSNFERTAKAIPVFVGPIVILFVRKIVQIWYTRIGDAEEKALVKLRKKQREKIEEVKQKTNYYSMRSLIERYESSPAPESPVGLRRRVPAVPQPQPPVPGPQLQQRQLAPQTPQRGGLQVNPQTPASGTLTPGLQQQLSPSPQRPLPPPRKQWFDKLADAILGDEDASTTGAASRYALICQKCFAHNGLVKESRWEDAQYVCPKCGYFNPSARTIREIKEGKKSRSPDGRSPFVQSAPASKNHFAPPIGTPIAAEDGRHAPTTTDEPTSMDVDS